MKRQMLIAFADLCERIVFSPPICSAKTKETKAFISLGAMLRLNALRAKADLGVVQHLLVVAKYARCRERLLNYSRKYQNLSIFRVRAIIRTGFWKPF